MLHLKNRSVIKILGPDSIKFLNNILTNEIKHPCYALLLNSQGKYLYDFFISIVNEQEIFLDCSSLHKSYIMKLLEKYKITLRCKIVGTDLEILHSPSDNCIPKQHVQSIIQDPRHKELGFRIFAKSCIIENTISFEEYERLRITHCIPDGDSDMVSSYSYPFEFPLDYAISWEKGCYTGQEVLARVKYRGQTKRMAKKVYAYNENLPIKGKELVNEEGTKVGIMLSSMQNIGMALINKEQGDLIDEKGRVYKQV